MNAEHTPGPWTVQLSGMRGSFHIVEAKKHEAAAADTDGVDGYTVSKANARLIAAAPDMYDLLESVSSEENRKDWWRQWDKRKNAVIAKARGET